MKKITFNNKNPKRVAGTIINTLFLLIIGLLLILKPNSIISTISTGFGFFLMVAGILLLINYFRNDYKTFVYRLNFGYGVISIIAGAVLISNPEIFANLFVFAIGTWIVLNSIKKIKFGLNLRDLKLNMWKYSLTLGVINLIVGIYFLIYPFQVAEIAISFIGIIVIIHALFDFINIYMLKDQIKDDGGPNIIDVEDLNEK